MFLFTTVFRPSVLISALLLVVGVTRTAPAQSRTRDAAGRGAAISLFAEPQLLHPGYFTSGHSVGLAGGADFTRFFRTPVLPSLELRATYSPTGANDGETAVMAGARFDLPVLHLGRVHPYADFLLGPGTIHFAHPASGYLSDTSTVYNYGGGLDYTLLHHFALQAEFQQQHWNLGNKTNSISFTPYSVNVGVRYQIPFGFERAH